jgi:hypothetical protein
MQKTPRTTSLIAASLLSILNSQFSTVFAQTTAFNHQGWLNTGGIPANGRYGLIFQIFDAANVGSTIGGVTTDEVPVTNGLFMVVVDFGTTPFTGLARWLQIRVSTNGTVLLTKRLKPQH